MSSSIAPSTRRQVQDFVNQRGIRLRRQWGQSFLIDRNILDLIMAAADISPADIVLEIGPGAGVLTERLLEKAGLVVSVEIDRGLAAWIGEAFGARTNLMLLNQDVMGAHNCLADEVVQALHNTLATSPRENTGIKVVANLPYSISSPVIIALLESPLPITSLTVMLQYEVGRKMVAAPGGEDFGLLSLLCALNAESRLLHKVSHTCFWPQPKVDSVIVGMRRRPMLASTAEYETVKEVARKLFQFRRKSLVAAAKHGMGMDRAQALAWLERAGIDPTLHAEVLDLAAFRKLSAAL